MRLLPRRFPYWCINAHRTGPVFDIYWLGFFSLVIDRTKAYYPRGWLLQWHDDD